MLDNGTAYSHFDLFNLDEEKLADFLVETIQHHHHNINKNGNFDLTL